MSLKDGFTRTGPYNAVCKLCGAKVMANALAYAGHIKGKAHQAALAKAQAKEVRS